MRDGDADDESSWREVASGGEQRAAPDAALHISSSSCGGQLLPSPDFLIPPPSCFDREERNPLVSWNIIDWCQL